MLDGAHNPDGARALAASLSALFGTAARATFVVGVYADKDAGGIFDALRPVAARFVLTRAASDRAADPGALARLVPPGIPVVVAPSVAEALSVAEREAATPIVCVAGSLAGVGEALSALAGGNKPCPIEIGPDSMDSLF